MKVEANEVELIVNALELLYVVGKVTGVSRENGDHALVLSEQIRKGDRFIAGIMAESFIEAGNQAVIPGKEKELVYGQSITDPCLDWNDTMSMLDMLATAIKSRQ